jgi:hypothetical protein
MAMFQQLRKFGIAPMRPQTMDPLGNAVGQQQTSNTTTFSNNYRSKDRKEGLCPNHPARFPARKKPAIEHDRKNISEQTAKVRGRIHQR